MAPAATQSLLSVVLVALAARVVVADCTDQYTDLSGASAVTYATDVLWFKGQRTWCWPFGDRQSTVIRSDAKVAANPILFVKYPDGESAGAPIVSVLPCQDGYSDAWLRFDVTVDYTVPRDSFRDVASIKAAGLSQKRIGYFNLPIVPPGSVLSDWSGHPTVSHDILPAWFNGQKVFYADFYEIPMDNILDYVPTADAVAVFEDDSHGVPVKNGFTVVDAIPGSKTYTGFYAYLGSNTTGSPYNFLRFYSNFTTGQYVAQERGIVLNCPTAFTETFQYIGDPPLPPAGAAAAPPAQAIPPSQAPTPLSTSACYASYLSGPAGSYQTEQGWYGGKQFGCWNLGFRSTAHGGHTNETHVSSAFAPVYQSGSSAGLTVFNILPCQNGYSDAVEVINVIVPDAVPFNFFSDYSTVVTAINAGTATAAPKGIFNWPIVEPGSTIAVNSDDKAAASGALDFVPTPILVDAWYHNTQVFYFDFGPVSNAIYSSDAPYFKSGSVAFPYKDAGFGNNILFGDPVFSTVNGNSDYTGFFGASKISVKTENEYKDFTKIDDKSSDLGQILNCPYAYFL